MEITPLINNFIKHSLFSPPLICKMMNTLDDDFDDMMRVRNEAKKRLEEKFKDVYQ